MRPCRSIAVLALRAGAVLALRAGLWVALAACAQTDGRARPLRALGHDPLGRRYLRLVHNVAGRGYEIEGEPQRLLLLEGQGGVREVSLGVGRCYTFVGIATPAVRDLNLAVYDGSGDPVVEDRAEDAHSVAHVCPQRTDTYYAVARVPRGDGVALVGMFVSEPGSARGLDGVWQGVSVPATPSAAMAPRFAAVEGRLGPRGFRRLESWSGALRQGESDRRGLALETGACYALAGAGAESVEDLDVFVYDPLGSEVARDIRTDAQPIVEFCPPATGRYTVEIKMYAGTGNFIAAAFRGPLSSAPPTPREVSASGPVDLAVEMVRVAAMLGTMAYRSVAPALFAPALGGGESREHDLALEPGCYAIVARGGAGITDLDASIRDDKGDLVDRDAGPDPTSIVRVCVRQSAAFKLAVRAYGGAGEYAIERFRSSSMAADLLSLRLAEGSALSEAEGHLLEGPPSGGSLRTGEAWSRETAFEAGACYAILGAGGIGVDDLDLFIYDRQGVLVGSDTSPGAAASLRYCPTESGPYRIEVRMFNGEGPFLVGVGRRR